MNFPIISNLKWLYLLLSPLFVFLFNEFNEILPNADGQHYLDLSLMQYKVFIDNGFFEGINSLYNLRSGGLRPLIFPSLVTPFMLLVNGDIYLTVSLVMAVIAGLWTYYCYKLISMTGNYVIAVFGAVVIVIWPGFSYYHYNFFSETLHITLLTATIYYILNSNLLNNKKDIIKAGIYGGLTLCVRPELLFIVPFGLIPFLYKYFIKNKNFWHESKSAILIFIIFVTVMHAGFLSFISPLSNCEHCISNMYRSEGDNIFYHFLILIIAIISLATICYKNNSKRKLSLTFLISIILFICVIWYFPYVDELFEWFRVGYFNLQDHNNPVADSKRNLMIIYPVWGSLLLVLFSCSIISFAFSSKEVKKNFIKYINKNGQLLIIGFIIVLIYLLLLLNESAGITPVRRTAPGLFLLCTGFFAFLASFDGLKVRKILNIIVITYSILLVVHSTSAFRTISNNYFFDFASSIRNVIKLPWQHTVYNGHSKPNLHLVKEVNKLVEKNNLNGEHIYIPTFTHWPPDVTHGLIVAQRLLDSNRDYKLKMWISHPGYLSIKDLKAVSYKKKINDIKNYSVNYLLVDTFPEYSDQDLKDKFGHHFYPGWKVLYDIRNNKIEGIIEIDRLFVNGRTYILYKI